MACVFEAILGAIYLDLGVDICRNFLIDNFEDIILNLAEKILLALVFLTKKVIHQLYRIKG